MSRHYESPDVVANTVFDPSDDTFGPIMAALQAGEFATAALLTRNLADPATEAKITQIIGDADAKYAESAEGYYAGFRDGLRRALNVIQGKG